MDFAEPWLDNRGSGSLPDMLSATRTSCQYIAESNELGAIALLGVDIVFRLFSLEPSTPFNKSLDSIETLLGELCYIYKQLKVPFSDPSVGIGNTFLSISILLEASQRYAGDGT